MNTMTTVKAVSARIRYNNYDDENRTYDIAADVDVSNGVMGTVSNGSLVPKGSGMGQGVSFDSSMGYKRLEYYDKTIDEISAHQAINNFIASVNALITSNPSQI